MNWNTPEAVAGFAASLPNAMLIAFADAERSLRQQARALDIGCGTARNAVPLARSGWEGLGTDVSWPMLEAAARRREADRLGARLHFTQASMTELPVRDNSIDLIVAHGIWNLASSSAEFRCGVREAARAGKPGAHAFPLHVFTPHIARERQTRPWGAVRFYAVRRRAAVLPHPRTAARRAGRRWLRPGRCDSERMRSTVRDSPARVGPGYLRRPPFA